jgi:hypothetical protein
MLPTTTWASIAALRLERQRLADRAPHDALLDVVRGHVGIQAQVMSSASLALHARVDGLGREDVQRALWQDRSLVKTWAMRGTLHLVAATELPGIVRGLGTRLNWLSPVWLRYFKVTHAEMIALQDGIGDVLTDEPMTREELATHLARRLGDPAFAERVTSSWGTFLKPAAALGRLAFGPDRGRNVTFVHPAAWLGAEIPDPDERGVDDAALRHLRAFPGSTKGELARWWGVAPGRLTAPLARLGDRVTIVDIEGTRALVAAEDVAALAAIEPAPRDVIRLLGGFDPYTLSLQKEAEPLLPMARRPLVSRAAGWISAVVLLGGAVAGTWGHEVTPTAVTLTIAPWRRLTKAERSAVDVEAHRIAGFLAPGTATVVRVGDPS